MNSSSKKIRKLEIAKSMLENDIKIDNIIKITKLSKEV